MRKHDDIVRRVLDATPKGGALAFGPFTDAPAHSDRIDGQLTVCQEERKYRFLVAIEPTLQAATIPRLITLASHTKRDTPLLVLAEHVNPNLANVLREHGIAFLDAAGNAYLSRPGLYCQITGQRRTRQASRATGMLHQRSGLKLVFALLTDPSLENNADDAWVHQATRGIANPAGISVGSVSALLRELTARRFLLTEDNGHRRLVEREALIEKWSAAFVERLRPKLITHRFHSRQHDWWRTADLAPAGLLWGGEVAAARLTDYLQPEHLTIYAQSLPAAWAIRSGLEPDPDGEIEILSPFWTNAVEERWRHPGTKFPNDCVHPLLVYADLLAVGDDRNIETARRLYDTFLRPIAEAH